MKSKWIKLAALATALCLVAGTFACSLTDKPAESGADTETAAGDVSRDAVAVRIGSGDDYVVTRGDVEDGYDSQVSMYETYGMSAPTADADIESMQDYVVENLIKNKLLLYEANLMGLSLDEKGQDGVDADLEDEMAYYYDAFRSQAESEGAADVEARAEEIFNEELANAGMDMDVDGYRAYVRSLIESQALTGLVEEKVKAEVTATDEEIQTYYDDLLAAQKETYAATPENYLTDMENYEKFGGDPVLVTPEGYVRVKTITVSPAEEMSADYETLKTDMTTLEAEYGKLALENAAVNAARMTEITKAYHEKKTEADKLYEAYISAAREKATKAYEALAGGAAFDEVLKEFGEDDVYTTYPSFVTTGLLMQKGAASSTWPEALVEAVGKLKPGEYTAVIPVDDMFYICSLVGDEPAGETPFSDVTEEITVQAAAEKGEAHWTEQQDAWMNDTSIVTYYEDVYRSVGK